MLYQSTVIFHQGSEILRSNVNMLSDPFSTSRSSALGGGGSAAPESEIGILQIFILEFSFGYTFCSRDVFLMDHCKKG